MPTASIKMQKIFIFSTLHRKPPIAILCIFIGAIQQVTHLGRGVDEESNKNAIERRVCSQKSDVPHTNSSMHFFLYRNLYSFLVSHKAPIISQRATKKAYQCIWNNYLIFTQKYYNSTTLSMWVAIHMCVSKNLIMSKDLVLYLPWYDESAETAIYAKKIFFSFILKFLSEVYGITKGKW